MKLIIIEGTDNTGKDTIISKLLERFPTTTLIHCSKPFSKKFSDKEQDQLFKVYIENIVNGSYDSTHCIIMNRSHIGEFVYGTLYRNRPVDDVCRMVFKLNNKLNERTDLDIRYVQLVCTSEKLLQKNEDGKSLSEGADYRISMETSKFQEIFKCCDFPKKLVYVNNGDEFRSRESIFDEVWKFIDN